MAAIGLGINNDIFLLMSSRLADEYPRVRRAERLPYETAPKVDRPPDASTSFRADTVINDTLSADMSNAAK
jgi:hypothetical protein